MRPVAAGHVADHAGLGDLKAQLLRAQRAAQARGHMVAEVLVGQGGAADIDATARAQYTPRCSSQRRRRVQHMAIQSRAEPVTFGGAIPGGRNAVAISQRTSISKCVCGKAGLRRSTIGWHHNAKWR